LTAPVLLLHGQPGSAGDWNRVVAALGHRRTITFDRPGWDGVRPPSGLPGNAEAALTELDVHGAERAVVVGHSFGGAIAAWLAAWFPNRVSGLVLIAPSANTESLYAVDRVLAAPVVGEAMSALMLGAAGWGLSVRRMARLLGGDERHLLSVARRLRSPYAWTAFVAEQRALFADLPRLEPELRGIQVPTRILAGTRDWAVPIGSLRKLESSIPGAELRLIPRAGHLIPLRQPQTVAEAIASVS
jgi:pimeloyl-ACP methyl ester carboxylesterase